MVDVMGGDCGYLAPFSGLGTSAERINLPDEPVSLADLHADVVANLRQHYPDRFPAVAA